MFLNLIPESVKVTSRSVVMPDDVGWVGDPVTGDRHVSLHHVVDQQ